MENFYIHNAIRSLYPNVVTVRGEESFDENNNLIEIDMDAVNIEAEKLSQIKPVNLNDIIQELSKKVTELENIVATK
tara:strand:+ start:850 stop:1080 length:231 start_codon:yes stop_codon:yes gene_type:complete